MGVVDELQRLALEDPKAAKAPATGAKKDEIVPPWMRKDRPKKYAGGRCKRQKGSQKQQETAEGASRVAPAPAPPPGRRPGVAPLRAFLPSAARDVAANWAVIRAQKLRGDRGGTGELVAQLRRMQCPLLWGLRPVAKTVAGLYRRLDSTPHRPSPWHVAAERVHLACEFARLRALWKGRELLEEVYAMLAALPGETRDENQNLQDGGDKLGGGPSGEGCLLRRYRAGLKHVLDASWLLLRDDADFRAGRPLPDGTPVAHVSTYHELSDGQKASVLAMKALMSRGDTEAATQATELDPGECQWLYAKALSMRAARARRSRLADVDELEPEFKDCERDMFQRAYDACKSPQTVVGLARCFAAGKETDKKRCAELVREALELFPESAYVQLRCGVLLDRVARDDRARRLAFVCFRQALHLGGPDWMRACLCYGTFSMNHGRRQEATYYMKRAKRFFGSDF